MKNKANPSVLFLYGLFLTILAFALRKIEPLIFSAFLNMSIGLILGFKKREGKMLFVKTLCYNIIMNISNFYNKKSKNP